MYYYSLTLLLHPTAVVECAADEHCESGETCCMEKFVCEAEGAGTGGACGETYLVCM